MKEEQKEEHTVFEKELDDDDDESFRFIVKQSLKNIIVCPKGVYQRRIYTQIYETINPRMN